MQYSKTLLWISYTKCFLQVPYACLLQISSYPFLRHLSFFNYNLTGFYNIQVWFRACSAHNLFFKFYLASVLCAWLTRSSFSKCFLAFRMLIRVASEAASKTQKQCYSICSNEIHKWKIISSSPFHGTNRSHRCLALCGFLSIWHFQFVLHIIIIVYSTIKLAEDLTHSIKCLK